MKKDFGVFQVGLKIMLRRGHDVLLLRTAKSHAVDFPGGRIDNIEYAKPIAEIIAREVREELGPEIRYRLGGPLFQFRAFSPSRKMHIFITVYEAEYLAGPIRLSREHARWAWTDTRAYRPRRRDFRSEEFYRAFLRYLDALKDKPRRR